MNQHFTCVPPGSGGGRGANVQFGCYQVLGNLHIRSGQSPSFTSPSGHPGQGNQRLAESVDGNPLTKWCFEHGGKTVQWQAEISEPATPKIYQFTSAEDMPQRDPLAWKLEGSMDGKTWVMLDERKGQQPFAKRHESKSYDVTKPTACRFFRFTFPPNPGVPHFQLAEIALDGVTSSVKPNPASYRRTLDLGDAIAGVDVEAGGLVVESGAGSVVTVHDAAGGVVEDALVVEVGVGVVISPEADAAAGPVEVALVDQLGVGQVVVGSTGDGEDAV